MESFVILDRREALVFDKKMREVEKKNVISYMTHRKICCFSFFFYNFHKSLNNRDF